MSTSSLQLSIAQKIHELGSKKRSLKGKASYTHFHKRILQDFVKFIDNPYCFKNGFSSLYNCQSKAKPLQKRQRADLVKLVAVLFTYTDVENLQIGVSDTESMKTVPHYSIRSRFEKVWEESITKSKYFRLVNLLKLAGYLDIDAVFIFDKEILSNPNFNPNDVKRIRSKAAYKKFTDKFFLIFERLYHMSDVLDSREKSIAKRIKDKLKNVWEDYKPFSDSYHYKKRRNLAKVMRDNEQRYPQSLT